MIHKPVMLYGVGLDKKKYGEGQAQNLLKIIS